MTTRGTLPPQAYTRETLSQAFQWLQTQPESIRKMAENPDALVGLFLRAKRHGDMTLENTAPVSKEDFRNTLKNIASELQQFSTQTAKPVPEKTNYTTSISPLASQNEPTPLSQIPQAPKIGQEQPVVAKSLELDFQEFANGFAYESQPPVVPTMTTVTTAPAPQVHNNQHKESVKVTATTTSPVSTLDTRSQKMLQIVQERFNLSSEGEALRMLIVLGYERAQTLFEK